MKDSVSPGGIRLTTFEVSFPKYLQAEVNTHRMLSKNCASSRAMPADKVLAADPSIPMSWGRNRAGMQSTEHFVDPQEVEELRAMWRQAGLTIAGFCRELSRKGVHKSLVNRLYESQMSTVNVWSATDWENMEALRCEPQTEDHLCALMWMVADALHLGPPPIPLALGEWHTPYVDAAEGLDRETAKKVSAGRCAQASYYRPGSADIKKALEIHDRLFAVGQEDDPMAPLHMSPAEHVATPLEDPEERSGNFLGWRQLRKEFPKENMKFDYQEAVRRGWREAAYRKVGLL